MEEWSHVYNDEDLCALIKAKLILRTRIGIQIIPSKDNAVTSEFKGRLGVDCRELILCSFR